MHIAPTAPSAQGQVKPHCIYRLAKNRRYALESKPPCLENCSVAPQTGEGEERGRQIQFHKRTNKTVLAPVAAPAPGHHATRSQKHGPRSHCACTTPSAQVHVAPHLICGVTRHRGGASEGKATCL